MAVDPGNMVEADIMREEVMRALNRLRQKSAPVRDGVTVEMYCEVLVCVGLKTSGYILGLSGIQGYV